jgi:hypothetical protein
LPNGFELKKTSELFANIDRGENHSLLEGLRHRDLFAFNNVDQHKTDSYVVKYAFNVAPETLDNAEVIANCSTYLRRAAVAEYFTDRGSVIFSQIECTSRAGKDPVADKVFVNLLNTFVEGNNQFGEQSDWVIDFTDFDSERGLFTLPLEQGIIINSHNYGRVSYGDVPGASWGATWHDGRRVVSRQRIYRSLGYIEAVDSDAANAEGFFWVRPPNGAKAAVMKVSNPTDKPLGFKISAGKDPKRFVVRPKSSQEFGKVELKPADNGAVKFVITTTPDPKGQGKEKKLIEELVFNSLEFVK